MADTPISKLTAAGTLIGDEPTIVSQRSTSIVISAATISALASDNSFNDSGSGFVTAGFAVGDYVNVSGFTGNTANNIFSAEITALTAGKMTIGGSDGAVIVDDAAGETVTISKWVSRRSTLSVASLMFVPLLPGQGTVSSSGNATKGEIFITEEAISIAAVAVDFHDVGTYVVQIVTLNGSNVVTALLGTSPSKVVAAASRPVFKFSSRIAVAAGSRVAICVVRTDGATTASCNVRAPTADVTGPGFTDVGFFVAQRNVALAATGGSIGTVTATAAMPSDLIFLMGGLAAS